MQDETKNKPSGLPLGFDGPLVIVGGGTLDELLLRELAAGGAHLVGADGGGNAIKAAGLVPEAVIGDFDSLDQAGWDSRTRLIHIAEQDTTDFEKVLYSTTAPVTIGLGMTGKRLDHTLAALDAVARYARERPIILVDECDIALALTGPFAFTVDVGARVSVHPLTPTRFFRSTGLKYSLDGLTLAPGVRTGTSNEASAVDFAIEPATGDEGVYLLILERLRLGALIARLLAG
ncbi:MAG TPA: thiamine diphosphokinase [Devosiaceae bacterium]|nr:thiamine diphosphokinase [Devosiaceae bacterium]